MKKLFLSIVACFLVAGVSSAQTSFEKGDNVVSLGVAFGGNLYTGYSAWKGYTRLPTFSLAYENCIIGNLFNDKSALGIGGSIDYSSSKYNSSYGYGWKQTYVTVGARGALHYSFVDKLDTYAGLFMGYNIHSWKWTDGTGDIVGSSGFSYNLFIGARYYFANSIGVFAEAGYGYYLLKAGVAFKF